MTSVSRTSLNAQINADLADNTEGDISAQDVRQVALNQSDSAFNKISDNASDIEDGGGKVIMTDAERTKLDNTPDSFDKDTVGLGNVDNTSDADKPISDATQAALDEKLSDITGLIQQGTNITITGAGTDLSPYVINSSGGGGSAAPKVFNPLDYGVVANGVVLSDVTTTSGSPVISSASYSFVSGDVGKAITVHNLAVKNDSGTVNGTILSVSAGQATLSANAPSTISGTATATFGKDDTAALIATNVAANTAGGGIIIIPAGIMMVSASIFVYPNVSWIGRGYGFSIFKWCSPTTMNSAVFQGTGGSTSNYMYKNQIYDNFQIDLEGARQPVYNVAGKGFYITYMENPTFSNLLVRGSPATAIGIDNLKGGIIKNCRIFRSGRRNSGNLGGAGIGIGTRAGGESYIIANNIIESPTRWGIFMESQNLNDIDRCPVIIIGNIIRMDSTSFGYGIAACGVDGVIIDSNSIVGEGTGTGSGIGVINGTTTNSAPGVKTTIRGNKVRGMGANGISVDFTTDSNPSFAQDTVIDGNFVYECVGHGIYYRTTPNNAAIYSENLVVTNNQTSKNTGSGIFISCSNRGRQITINGNQSYNNNVNGILVAGAPDTVRITNNACYDTQSPKTQQYGVNIGEPFAGSSICISNNDLRGNLTASFRMFRSAAGVVTGYFYDNLIESVVLSAGQTLPGRPAGIVTNSTAVAASPYSIGVNESGKTYTNTGATARAYFNLPTPVAGLNYSGIVTDTDGIRFVAPSGVTIRDGSTVSASGGYLESVAIGTSFRLESITATEYIVTSKNGTITVT